MNRFVSCRIWLFILLWLGLVGCIGNMGEGCDAAAITPTASMVSTVEFATVFVCQDLGCESNLDVQLTGNVPSTLVVEVSEPRGMVAVGACFPSSQDVQGVLTREEIDLDDEKAVNKLQTALGNVPLCSNTEATAIEVYRSSTGALYSLLATCSAPNATQNSVLLSCSRESIVSFFGFTPSHVSIKVYAGKEVLEVEHAPEYTIFSPNDPQCTPKVYCQTATVTVDIP